MGHSISENSLSGRAPPCGGRSPSGGVPIRQGQGPFLFLRKKKRALTPKKNEAGLRGVDTGKTAACVFTHCLGTPPGRYGHHTQEQRPVFVLSICRLLLPLSGPVWWGASLALKREPCTGRDDSGAPPHSAARVAHPGGPKIEPLSFLYSTMGWP